MPTRTELMMRIAALYNDGMHPADIADHMHMSVDMVEEIIDHRCVLEGL